MADAEKSRKHRPKDELRIVPGVGEDESHKLVHERVRLAIVSSLAVNSALTFTEMKELLGITDGNLSIHARKLEEGGLIKCSKSFVDRTPRTEYRITPRGRKVLESYLGHMEALIRAVRRG